MRTESQGILVDDGADGCGRRAPAESTASCKHLVKHCSKRENIGARVGRLALDLLWRYVRRSSHDHALRDVDGLGFLCVGAGDVFCESEIQQLYNTFRGHQDVRWFEIAMNYPLDVSGFERGSDLPGEAQNRGRRKRLRLFRGDNRCSANILHDQIVRTDIVNLADIGMAHANGRKDFVRAEFIAGRERHIGNRAESSLFRADRE